MALAGHVVFCPQRTASLSIARSWSCLQTPVLHTHDLCRFVVFDKRSSPFLDFVRVHFGVELVVDLPVESVPDFDVDFENDFDGMIQYTVEVLDKAKTCLLFKFFGSLKFVTSVRNPLATRVTEFLESITVEHVNSVMDDMYPECKRLRLQPAVVAELCHFRLKMKRGSSCPTLLDALDIVSSGKRLLSIDNLYLLFEKHFVGVESSTFTDFFDHMQEYVTPDFDLEHLSNGGFDVGEYCFCGVGAEHLVMNLESMSNPRVKCELQSFTGIREFGIEHHSEFSHQFSHHLFLYPVLDIEQLLLFRYRNATLSEKTSTEGQITAGLGY